MRNGTLRHGARVSAVMLIGVAPAIMAPQASGEAPSEAPAPSSGVSAQTSTARAVLARVAAAVGDPDAIRAAGGILVETRGTQDRGAERQGHLPGSRDVGEYAEWITVGPDLERVAFEYLLQRNDTTSEHIRELYGEPRERFVIGLDDPFVVRLLADDNVAGRRRILSRIPQLLIAELARDPDAELLADGSVRATVAGGRPLTLAIDPATDLPATISYDLDFPTLGDTRVQWRLGQWFEVTPFGRFPRSLEVTIGEATFLDLAITGVHAPANLDRLTVPPDSDPIRTVEPPADASANASVETLAPGVHRVVGLRPGFHPMFVELDDSVVAVDAPAGYPLLAELPAGEVAPGTAIDWLSVRFIELIRATVPDKPIGHVVLTHFHNDHAGGVRAFIAEGAAVWVATGEADAVRAFAGAPHRLAPDTLARHPRPAVIREVDGAARIGDETRTVEIFDTGANPHTAHNLVVRVSDVGIVFTSDLFQPAPLETYPDPTYAALDAFFARWLLDLGFDFERIYAMHATGYGGREHLDAAIR